MPGPTFVAIDFETADSGADSACAVGLVRVQAGLAVPPLPFVCTVQVARRTWGLRPANLPAVCKHLNIPLKHHDPLSDAEAAACILIAARGNYASSEERLRPNN